jgi:hypothetical protein
MHSFAEIVDRLNERRQRATYGALAGVLDRPAAFVMAGHPRDVRHSWIVNARTLRPTGFREEDIHPELSQTAQVLMDAASLLAWIGATDQDLLASAKPAEGDTWWHSLNTQELLEGYDGVMRELRRRNVVRSSNNPVADLAEQIGSVAFGLRLGGRSTKGHDGIAPDGSRWQIKGRRRTPENRSKQLGVLRNLGDGQFDHLLAIYFDSSFAVEAAYRIDLSTVQRHAKFRKSVNGHILRATSALVADAGCVDVTLVIRDASSTCHGEIFAPAL